MFKENNYERQIIIFINTSSLYKKKSAERIDNLAKHIIKGIKTIDKLCTTVYHTSGTNVIYYIPSQRGTELSNNLKTIEKIDNVDYYLLYGDYLEEINIAKETHDYFKAYSLGCSVIEYYGKKILREYFI